MQNTKKRPIPAKWIFRAKSAFFQIEEAVTNQPRLNRLNAMVQREQQRYLKRKLPKPRRENTKGEDYPWKLQQWEDKKFTCRLIVTITQLKPAFKNGYPAKTITDRIPGNGRVPATVRKPGGNRRAPVPPGDPVVLLPDTAGQP
jgi:hypothetical protein